MTIDQAWTRHLPSFIRKKLKGRQQLQQIIGNTSWLLVDRILRMGVALIVGVWVARYLGPERYGMLSYALALVTLFSPLVSLGLEDVVVRDIVRDPTRKDETLGTAFVLMLIGSVVSFSAVIGTILFLRRDDSPMHWLIAIIAAGSIFQSFSIIECWFNSQIQARYAVLAKSASFFACSVIKIALIKNDATLIAFAWVSSVEIALGSMGLIYAYESKGGSFRNWQGTLKRARSLLKDSWPLAFAVLAMTIYERIDQVMLGEMAGSEEVGIYSVAVRLAEMGIFIPTALYWSFFPSIVKAKSVSDDQFYKKLQKFYNLMALSSYAIAVPVTIMSKWLVGFLYGETYAKAGLILSVLIWANIFTFLEIARSSFLATMNWTKAYLITVLLGAILNIVLNLVLIPKYGGIGAATASLIAYWFAVHGSCFLYKPLFKTGSMMTRAMLYPKIW